MTLSWGRIPAPRGATVGQRIGLVAIVIFATVTGGIVPRPLPVNTITPRARSEIAEVLSLHKFGIEQGHRFWIDYTVDQDRPRLASCMRELADDEGRLAQLLPFTLVRVEPYLKTYARAMVQHRNGPRRYYFRRVPTTRVLSPIISYTTWRWHISEPLDSEVADRGDEPGTSCP